MSDSTDVRQPGNCFTRLFRCARGVLPVLAALAAACSDDPAEFQIGGTVSGLQAGEQLTLLNQQADPIQVTANGPFQFPKRAPLGGSYEVTVGTQPAGQACGVSAGFGSRLNAAVDTVRVTCTPRRLALGGTVAGLAPGAQVTLINSLGESLVVTADGGFSFPGAIPFNGSYALSVGSPPAGQSCLVTAGTGSGVVADVSQVAVVCSGLSYALGGRLEGLAPGTRVTLTSNGQDLEAGGNGPFSFSGRLPYGGSYGVTVKSQPAGQLCTVSAGAGSGVTADVSGVIVSCVAASYRVGGAVSGLADGEQLWLQLNDQAPQLITSNGLFTFASLQPPGSDVVVTVAQDPRGQVCTIANDVFLAIASDVGTLGITCVTQVYPVFGWVSGLSAGQQLTLTLGSESLTLTSNQRFEFTTGVTGRSSYAVAISAQPPGAGCGLTSAATGTALDAIHVDVACLGPSLLKDRYIAPVNLYEAWPDLDSICRTSGHAMASLASVKDLFTQVAVPSAAPDNPYLYNPVAWTADIQPNGHWALTWITGTVLPVTRADYYAYLGYCEGP